MIEIFWQDLRYGIRMLAKAPGLTAVLAITLALGIGANTAIFTVLNGWLLRPLPIPSPEQIVVLGSSQNETFSYPDLVDYRKQANGFSGLLAYGLGIAGLSDRGAAHEFAYSSVTGNYFSVLGVKPAAGRLFLPGEGENSSEPARAVLGYSYWQKKFGGDPGVVGRQVLINGKSTTIVGVVQPAFRGAFFAFEMDGYLPLSTMAPSGSAGEFWNNRRNRQLMVLGRLKPGVSRSEAESAVSVIAARLAAGHPDTNQGVIVHVIPEYLARPAPFVSSFAPIIAELFLALAALVLLLACLNVANILLARAAARQREMAIRASLGAGRARLVRQMVTESLLIAMLGGVMGVAAGEWALKLSGSLLLSVTTTSNFGFKMDAALDWRVFAYTLAVVTFTGVFVGVWPAYRASQANVNAVLRAGGRSGSEGVERQRARNALMVAQVAGSLILLIVAGLFVRSLGRAGQMNLGFDPEHVLTMMLDPQQIGFDAPRAQAFYRDLKKRVRALPGVQQVSLSYATPMVYPGHAGAVFAEGRPARMDQPPPVISFNSVDSTFFETMRISILAGRAFAESDDASSRPVAIVNQTLARKLWPNQDPVGKRFSLKSAGGPFLEVVGTAHDSTYFFLSSAAAPHFYVPVAQNFTTFQSLQVRSSAPPEGMIAEIREQIHSLAPGLPIIDVRTMRDVVQGLSGLFIFRLAASLAALLGLLGVTLAVVGVYGVVSYSVSRRTQEIGIRMALGAGRGDVLRLALHQGLNLVLTGVLLGLVGAWISTRAMTRLLIGVSPADPPTYLIVATTLSVVALLACWIPARRAMAVDPMVALRYE